MSSRHGQRIATSVAGPSTTSAVAQIPSCARIGCLAPKRCGTADSRHYERKCSGRCWPPTTRTTKRQWLDAQNGTRSVLALRNSCRRACDSTQARRPRPPSAGCATLTCKRRASSTTSVHTGTGGDSAAWCPEYLARVSPTFGTRHGCRPSRPQWAITCSTTSRARKVGKRAWWQREAPAGRQPKGLRQVEVRVAPMIDGCASRAPPT
mmetsp:Transcript_42484/g.117223  ORF Transcript_42484/g.117223 Transcript_42484/m.117223 type:complete len:208 (-) Transcript_42484:203-826(-)